MIDESENKKREYDLKEIEVETIEYDGFVVARSEFFAKSKAPAMTIKYGEVYFNFAAIMRWEKVNFVQFLINKDDRKIAIRPCNEDDKDSLQWCRIDKNGKRCVRHISARYFAAKLYEDFNWNPDSRVKLFATLVKAKDEQIYIFDLDDATFQMTQFIKDENDAQKSRRITIPYFHESWAVDYGKKVAEHDSFLTQIENLPDGYVVLKQAPAKTKKAVPAEVDPTAEAEAAPENTAEVTDGTSE